MSPDPPDAPTDATASRPVRADVTTNGVVGVRFVAVTLRNETAVDVRVRVANDLDGPVLPPRRAGVPAAGWDEGGFTGVVPADARIGIGYACPVGDGDATDGTSRPDPDADTEPISLDILGPADGSDPPEPDRVAGAVRSLGRATPPADAVPTSPTVDADGPADDRRHRRRGANADAPDVPTSVAGWLDAVETRVRRAERLTRATGDEAAAVLEGCGGVDGVAPLPADVERDLAALRAVGDRIEALTARAAEANPEPVVSSLLAAADGKTQGDRSGPEARRTSGTADSESGERR